jgi:hypothetical protein
MGWSLICAVVLLGGLTPALAQTVRFAWTHPAPESLQAFRLYRDEGCTGDYRLLATLPVADPVPAEFVYRDTALVPNCIYCWMATSLSKGDPPEESGTSNVIMMRIPPATRPPQDFRGLLEEPQ